MLASNSGKVKFFLLTWTIEMRAAEGIYMGIRANEKLGFLALDKWKVGRCRGNALRCSKVLIPTTNDSDTPFNLPPSGAEFPKEMDKRSSNRFSRDGTLSNRTIGNVVE